MRSAGIRTVSGGGSEEGGRLCTCVPHRRVCIRRRLDGCRSVWAAPFCRRQRRRRWGGVRKLVVGGSGCAGDDVYGSGGGVLLRPLGGAAHVLDASRRPGPASAAYRAARRRLAIFGEPDEPESASGDLARVVALADAGPLWQLLSATAAVVSAAPAAVRDRLVRRAALGRRCLHLPRSVPTACRVRAHGGRRNRMLRYANLYVPLDCSGAALRESGHAVHSNAERHAAWNSDSRGCARLWRHRRVPPPLHRRRQRSLQRTQRISSLCTPQRPAIPTAGCKVRAPASRARSCRHRSCFQLLWSNPPARRGGRGGGAGSTERGHMHSLTAARRVRRCRSHPGRVMPG